MFTPQERQELKRALIDRARADQHVVGAGLVGSSATGEEDPWSDIDLALSVGAGEIDTVVAEWTALIYEAHGAVHHLDVWLGAILYRVFLLESTLQLDLSFWTAEQFAATGPRFSLLFGAPPPERYPKRRAGEVVVGEAWLYLLHARSSLARGRHWQANYMLAGVRDRVLELTCRRHDLRPEDARGVDDLPPALLAGYSAMVPSGLGADELGEALRAASAHLLEEAGEADPRLAGRIAATLEEIGAG
jgi:predicted nucleotidyltransferase